MLKQKFNGSDYDHERDSERLSSQLDRVFNVMKDGQWRSLHELSMQAKAPESSASAQLRHLRKKRFGGHTIEKKYLGNGLYLYRLEVKRTRPNFEAEL